MIRNERYKYVHRYPGGPHEFYDLTEDPGEEENRYFVGKYRETIQSMRADLGAWFTKYGSPDRDGATKAVTGAGQLGLAGDPQQGETPFGQLRSKNRW